MRAETFVVIILCILVLVLCRCVQMIISDLREVHIKVLKLETFILKDLRIIEEDRKTEQTEREDERCYG